MTVNVNKEKYGLLLMEHIPTVIKSEEQLDTMTVEIDRIMSKGIREGDLSPEEESLLDLLSTLVESYEDDHYPIPPSSPRDVLTFLMSDRGIKQSDLLPVFGSSGVASEVVNGKRSISKAQAKKLADFFKVSVEVFI